MISMNDTTSNLTKVRISIGIPLPIEDLCLNTMRINLILT